MPGPLARLLLASLIGVVTLVPSLVGAQGSDFPKSTVRIVVGSAPGGGLDAVARLVAQKLALVWKSPVIVDNRPGANGMLASTSLARTEPDGYTLMIVSSAFAINPSLYRNTYAPQSDYTPVIQLSADSYVIAVASASPVKSVGDLVEAAKASPGQINFSSPGIGSPGHLAGELFKSVAGVDVVHIPYNGAGPAMTALLGGEVQLIFASPSTAVAQLKSGRIRPLAVTGKARSEVLPDLPTVAEAGYRRYVVNGWYGIIGPPHMAAERTLEINRAIAKVLQDPEVKAQLHTQGSEAVGGSPKQFTDLLASEHVKWREVVKGIGAKPE